MGEGCRVHTVLEGYVYEQLLVCVRLKHQARIVPVALQAQLNVSRCSFTGGACRLTGGCWATHYLLHIVSNTKVEPAGKASGAQS